MSLSVAGQANLMSKASCFTYKRCGTYMVQVHRNCMENSLIYYKLNGKSQLPAEVVNCIDGSYLLK